MSPAVYLETASAKLSKELFFQMEKEVKCWFRLKVFKNISQNADFPWSTNFKIDWFITCRAVHVKCKTRRCCGKHNAFLKIRGVAT